MRIKLHGGPMHDKVMEVPEGTDHIHVMGIDTESMKKLYRSEDPGSLEDAVITKECVYSQVRGRPGDFEWEGFIQ